MAKRFLYNNLYDDTLRMLKLDDKYLLGGHVCLFDFEKYKHILPLYISILDLKRKISYAKKTYQKDYFIGTALYYCVFCDNEKKYRKGLRILYQYFELFKESEIAFYFYYFYKARYSAKNTDHNIFRKEFIEVSNYLETLDKPYPPYLYINDLFKMDTQNENILIEDAGMIKAFEQGFLPAISYVFNPIDHNDEDIIHNISVYRELYVNNPLLNNFIDSFSYYRKNLVGLDKDLASYNLLLQYVGYPILYGLIGQVYFDMNYDKLAFSYFKAGAIRFDLNSLLLYINALYERNKNLNCKQKAYLYIYAKLNNLPDHKPSDFCDIIECKKAFMKCYKHAKHDKIMKAARKFVDIDL